MDEALVSAWEKMRVAATPLRIALAVRILQAIATRTYASPDEYWQGPEVAHRLVWGTGYSCVPVYWSMSLPWLCKQNGERNPFEFGPFLKVYVLYRFIF